jgi:hypothetical protein
MASVNGFAKIRNGLLDHALAGKLSPFDFGLYVFLIMRADFNTGIYEGCALTIAYQFGDPSQKEHVQKALRRLRDKKYINYRNGDGSRGAYPILINKFEVTVGELCGARLNAWKHAELVQPEYEPQNGGGTVETLWRHCDGTVVAPNKDLKTLRLENEVKTLSSNPDGFDGAVREIFDYYLERTNRNSKTYDFTSARKQKAASRLKECLRKTAGDLEKAKALMKLAIDGIAASDFHMGRGPKTDGKKFCEWEKHVFKTYEQMEGWWNRAPETGVVQ